MSSINPLRFGVSGNQYFKQETTGDSKQPQKNDVNTSAKSESSVNSNTVLSYMAAQNADILPVNTTKKTVDVSNYVTEEQEARIAGFMTGFEADYDAAFKIAGEEFPELSEGAVSALALSYVNSAYEEE